MRAELATMGEGCGLRRRVIGAAMVVAIGLAVVAGANHPWVSAYGINSDGYAVGQRVADSGRLDGGVIAVGLGNQACVGVEVGGPYPGFFGSLTDASACDY